MSLIQLTVSDRWKFAADRCCYVRYYSSAPSQEIPKGSVLCSHKLCTLLTQALYSAHTSSVLCSHKLLLCSHKLCTLLTQALYSAHTSSVLCSHKLSTLLTQALTLLTQALYSAHTSSYSAHTSSVLCSHKPATFSYAERQIWSKPCQAISLISILVLSSHLYLGLPSSLSFTFYDYIPIRTSPFHHTCYISRPYRYSLFDV